MAEGYTRRYVRKILNEVDQSDFDLNLDDNTSKSSNTGMLNANSHQCAVNVNHDIDYEDNMIIDSVNADPALEETEEFFDCSWSDSDESASDSEDDCQFEDFNEFETSGEEKLAEWAVSFGIPQIALTCLLFILRNFFNLKHLPKSSNTLLKTPIRQKENYIIEEVPPGHYVHFGLKKQLENQKLMNTLSDTIELSVNIDGLPIANSSNQCLWPVLGKVNGEKNVFVIGIYHGDHKPADSNVFLRKFTDDVKSLEMSGVTINGKFFDFSLKNMILDAPAKSFVLKTKGHTGYSSCSKCDTEGNFDNSKMSFPEKGTLRTDQNFVDQTDDHYHSGMTILTEIKKFGLVNGIVLDFMHLLCIGVMKKLLLIWIGGKPLTLRLSSLKVIDVSNILVTVVARFTPSEFVRKARSLEVIKHWKATELRQFLLYTGPYVLKNHLHDAAYQHFLVLHCACRILCGYVVCDMVDYAEDLMNYFVQCFAQLYGSQNISHNIHGLYHLSNDVRNHGSVNEFSAFPFESYLYKMKRLVRKADKPLQQLYARYSEETRWMKMKIAANEDPIFKRPAQRETQNENQGIMYSEVNINGFKIRTDNNRDNCGLIENRDLIVVEQIVVRKRRPNECILVGKKFLRVVDFYKVSNFPSSNVGVYLASELSNHTSSWHLDLRKPNFKKSLKLPLEDEKFYVATLLH